MRHGRDRLVDRDVIGVAEEQLTMRALSTEILGAVCLASLSLWVPACGSPSDAIPDEASLRARVRRDLACEEPRLRPLRPAEESQPPDVVLVEGCEAPPAFYRRGADGRWALDPTMAVAEPAE